jgi:hypothetical protein
MLNVAGMPITTGDIHPGLGVKAHETRQESTKNPAATLAQAESVPYIKRIH